MASMKVKAELSKKNKYYISKHRYYELKHFCLQYNEWLEEYRELDSYPDPKNPQGNILKNQSDITSERAIKAAYLSDKINTIKRCCEEADKELCKWLLIGVTEERSYVYLKQVLDIPCCSDTYYDRYRKFFYILDSTRKKKHPIMKH